jgi:hypothetical protein
MKNEKELGFYWALLAAYILVSFFVLDPSLIGTYRWLYAAICK